MSEQFYTDWHNPQIERISKAIARAYGFHENTLVPESGYSGARIIPAWWKYQDDALKFVVCAQELGISALDSPPG